MTRLIFELSHRTQLVKDEEFLLFISNTRLVLTARTWHKKSINIEIQVFHKNCRTYKTKYFLLIPNFRFSPGPVHVTALEGACDPSQRHRRTQIGLGRQLSEFGGILGRRHREPQNWPQRTCSRQETSWKDVIALRGVRKGLRQTLPPQETHANPHR